MHLGARATGRVRRAVVVSIGSIHIYGWSGRRKKIDLRAAYVEASAAKNMVVSARLVHIYQPLCIIIIITTTTTHGW